MAQNPYIGQRLSYGNHICTVRYIGSVQGTEGQWLGVEWDDPSRGKHSGEHGGLTYFECNYLLIVLCLDILLMMLSRKAAAEILTRALLYAKTAQQIEREASWKP